MAEKETKLDLDSFLKLVDEWVETLPMEAQGHPPHDVGTTPKEAAKKSAEFLKRKERAIDLQSLVSWEVCHRKMRAACPVCGDVKDAHFDFVLLHLFTCHELTIHEVQAAARKILMTRPPEAQPKPSKSEPRPW